MPESSPPIPTLAAEMDELVARSRSLPLPQLVEALRSDQAQRWRAGQRLAAEAYLRAFPALAASAEDALVLIWGEVLLRAEAGEEPTPQEYRERFPQHADALAAQFELERHLKSTGSEESGVPATPTRHERPSEEGPGSRIGPYKVLQRIGEGGMGAIYLAEQEFPVRRQVALKIIKPGMDSKEVVARFEAERQALALMDHINIAKVLDAGTTAAGRPYFIMELVKGVPITSYCDSSRLTVRERLELFVPVCQAIQHAHQKGIIHRDVKPSNVLVTLYDGKPVVKVIDFGVAKAIGWRLTERTLFTHYGQVVGTLEYMSPEQAEMNALDVDTRSDIYSLGVLLYELLTGTTPLERERLREAGFTEVLRRIREEEAPRPSTRLRASGETLAAVAAQRRVEPAKLAGMIRGELDWIVLKALEKERSRRYQTANGLARDVERYLHDEPVEACPPSTRYRLRKFVRKYRTPLRIAAGLVVILLLATAMSMWQAVLATRAERQAVVERDRAEKSFRMARDAVDRLFTEVSQSPKLKAHGLEKFRKELLQNTKDFYERFIHEQFDAPGVRYDLGLAQYRLGEIYRELGDYAAAEESLTKAVELLGELVRAHPEMPEYQRDLATSYAALGPVHSDAARWEKAEAAFEQALAIQEKQVEAYPRTAEYRYALAKTYRASGWFVYNRTSRPEAAAARYQQALAILNKLVHDHPVAEYQALLATTQMNLGNVYAHKGWFEKSEAALKEAQHLYGRLGQGKPDVLPEHWQSLARSRALLGMAYRGQNQIEKAEAAQQQAMDIFAKLAKEHSDVLEYAYDQGRCYIELGLTANRGGRPDAAVAQYDKAIAILEDILGRGYGAARRALLTARIVRTTARAARGEHVQATAEAEAVLRQSELNAEHLYDLACTFSQSSAAADRDGKLSPAERAQLKARYADRAMDFLRQAVAEGWQSPQHLKTDPDVDPLRARQDFRKLSADLEAKTKE